MRKLFGTEKMINAYVPFRMRQTGNLTVREIENRLNNPTDGYGTYFTS